MRVCSRAQNAQNSKKHCNNASGYKGVVLEKRRGTFWAYIDVDGKRQSLKYFKTAEAAGAAYDAAAREHFGEFARTND
jgi:hypothetical protein